MNNIEFLKKHCPEALKDFEDLSCAAIRLKYHLSSKLQDGNEKLLHDAIIYHVEQCIGESYEEGLIALKKAGMI